MAQEKILFTINKDGAEFEVRFTHSNGRDYVYVIPANRKDPSRYVWKDLWPSIREISFVKLISLCLLKQRFTYCCVVQREPSAEEIETFKVSMIEALEKL